MKAFVIKTESQAELKRLVKSFRKAGIESDLTALDKDYDCIGTLNGKSCDYGTWYYIDYMFDDCKHFTPAQFNECLKYIQE